MTEGIRRADNKAFNSIQEHYNQFHLIGWNHHFYHQYRDITPDIPWVDSLIHKHGPTEQDIKEANSWHKRLGRIFFNLAEHIPLIIHLLPKEIDSAATEMSHYFDNTDNIAVTIRSFLKEELRPLIAKNEPVLIIGHSLGSVIAYDTLWELTHQEKLHGKLDFLTIGSPLGMHYVRRRLMGMNTNGTKKSYPKLIRHWTNLSSEGDIIALERNFNQSFKDLIKTGMVKSIEDHSHGIYNYFRNEEGLNCHRSYGYLVNPAVGHIIADWWNQN